MNGRCGAGTGGRRSADGAGVGHRDRAVQPAGARVFHGARSRAWRTWHRTTSAVSSPRFQGENFQRNLDLVAAVRQLAVAKGVTPAQLALAWLYAQGDDVVPIPGTRHRRYLEDNVAAMDVVLDAGDLARIEEVAPKGVAAGERYPDMRFVRGDTPPR